MRDEHIFQFKAEEIRDAAEAEHKYHTGRVVFWKNVQKEAVAKAKEAGVEVREQEVTGGIDVQVVLDPSVSRRLSQCAGKIRDHQSKADRFMIEAAAYGTQSGRTYDLTPDDIVYFRLAGGPRSDD